MANKIQLDPRNRFVPRRLPLLLGAAAFALFLLTLNHWITLFNLDAVAKIAGWTWQSENFSPLVYLVTYPFRWLPLAILPLALNVFSALCGALTIGLLARSVAILPHDRTGSERQAERSDFAFMTNKMAWLPPLLAAAACSLHAGFWENATNFTGEILQTTLFAFILWEILEFRLDEIDSRLYWATAAFAAGMADSWAFVGYFPFFFLALIWSKGVPFFYPSFLGRLILCALGGLSLFLLLPAVNVLFHNDPPQTFWQYLRPNLRMDWHALKIVTNSEARYNLGIISLTSFLPVFLLSIRWPESFGDSSRIGIALSNFLFHLINTLVLGVCLWIMFDPPFSPRYLSLFGTPGLTFYFLSALSIGYYSGYLLLVFGRWMGRPLDPNSPSLKRTRRVHLEKVVVQKIAVILIVAVSALAVAGLAYKNAPEVASLNSNILEQYGRLMFKSLPTKSGILLNDSESQSSDLPWRLYLLQAELARNGLEKDFLPLDTQSLNWPAYHRFLHKKYPDRWPLEVSPTDQDAISPLNLVSLLKRQSKTNNLYYLNPSFGYYFEYFYPEPHGLVYQLKLLPEDTLLPVPPDQKLTAENEAFWADAEKPSFGLIEKNLQSDEPGSKKNWAENLLKKLHVYRGSNPNALLAGVAFSQTLNYWGVCLQQNGELLKANHHFSNALKLNPDNIVAEVNRDFNQTLQAGKKISTEFSEITSDQFGRYRSWNEVHLLNGPFDEPNYALNMAVILLQGGYYREALAELVRVHALIPDSLPARLLQAQVYVVSQMPEQALGVLREPLQNPKKFGLTSSNSVMFNFTAAAAYLQLTNYQPGIDLLKLEVNRHPDDPSLPEAATKGCLAHNLQAQALDFINIQLARTPGDPHWLFGKGFTLVQLKSFPQAADAFTKVLAVETNNFNALFNRAIAYLSYDQFALARTDYLRLQQTYTNAWPVAYGLSEIARHQHDTNEIIRNYQIYLANAPTNTAEVVSVRKRLAELRGQ